MGLASALAAPTQITIVASRSPSYRPKSSDSWVTEPEQAEAEGPVRQRDRRQVEQHAAAVAAADAGSGRSTRITTIARPSQR